MTSTALKRDLDGLKVKGVNPEGIGAAVGILPGDVVERINGEAVRDPIDYRFHVSEEAVLVLVRRGSEVWEAEVEKDADEDLGLTFEDMEILKCDNACVFCFLHQMPKGMRRALYYQDDDYRLSFLHGAYVTLTNLSEGEFERIVDQRLSPVYISVHATDPDVRGHLLGRRGPDDVLPRVERLAASGIQMHTQVVLCPGLNDGERLKQTVFDLARWHPHVASVGIVPLGLTRYRKNLPDLTPVTPDFARQVIAQVGEWRTGLRRRLGTHFVYLSDEFYLMTGAPIPPPASYDGFPLVENGVGMVRRFLDLFEEGIGNLEPPSTPARITLVTSVLGGGVLSPLVDRLNRLGGLRVELRVTPNRFFGDGITVSGLLTGADIRDALRASPVGDLVLLPPNCVSYEGLFLDDLTPSDLERDLGVRVAVGTYDLVESVQRALQEGGEDLHAGKGRRPGHHPYISASQYA